MDGLFDFFSVILNPITTFFSSLFSVIGQVFFTIWTGLITLVQGLANVFEGVASWLSQ